MFLTVLCREEAFSAFKENIMSGGEKRRDMFGNIMQNDAVLLEDLQGGLSTR
jgi:hypothetical protein